LNKRKIISTISIIVICTSILFSNTAKVSAASKYIKTDNFIKMLVTELKLNVSIRSGDPYITAAKEVGIIKDEDTVKLSAYITRADAAVYLNRADEYLHGDTVHLRLLTTAMEKRISDITNISEERREAVAKVYAKGIIKGYSNGYYKQTREFRGSEYISEATAIRFIDLLVNPSKRAKVSPDGILIRTRNLPKNASNYEYILECYPNNFYERKFEFMFSEQYKAGERDPLQQIYPVNMRISTFRTWNEEWPFSIEMDKYLCDWADKAESYLGYLFNVDYRTVDDKWIEGLAACYEKSNIDEAELIKNYYIKHMKENKVIVECSVIAVEPSTLYYDGGYCMRAYVRYRITADDINVKQNRLLRCAYPVLENLKSGEWREGIFDVRFGTNNGYQGDGSYWAIDILTNFVDAYNVPVK
jgi:hypothetical protein